VGVGTSHYALPISATTWAVISQENGGKSGMWRTTTAGRTGGTAAQKFRDGTISTSAWTMASTHEHAHGSYAAVKVGDAWYSPGQSSIWKSTDDGHSWTDLAPGYYWASPPNAAFMNKNVTALAATANYVYSNTGGVSGPEIARAPLANDTDWRRDYVATPDGMKGVGSNPFGATSTYHSQSGKWMVFAATNNGIWRYIEP
jgi:hypothetical protein